MLRHSVETQLAYFGVFAEMVMMVMDFRVKVS